MRRIDEDEHEKSHASCCRSKRPARDVNWPLQHKASHSKACCGVPWLQEEHDQQKNIADFRSGMFFSSSSNGRSLHGLWRNNQHLQRERSLSLKSVASLVCVCLCLLVVRSGDIRQRVLAPWLNTLRRTTAMGKMVAQCCHDMTDIVDLSRNGNNEDLENRKTDSRSVFLSCLNVLHVSHKQPHCADEKSEDEDEEVLTKTVSNFIVPRVIQTVTVCPVSSFLPAAGSSSRDAMSHLGGRLASLSALPASCKMSRVRLAQAGFYYDASKTRREAGNSLEMSCYSCRVSYSQWKDGDNPESIHQRLNPNCPHLKDNSQGSGGNTLMPVNGVSVGHSSLATVNGGSVGHSSLATGNGGSVGHSSLATVNGGSVNNKFLMAVNDGRPTSMVPSGASSGYGSWNGEGSMNGGGSIDGGTLNGGGSLNREGSMDTLRPQSSGEGSEVADAAPLASHPAAGGGWARSAAVTPQSSSSRVVTAVQSSSSSHDLQTDSAAIYPSPVTSPPAHYSTNQNTASRSARDSNVTAVSSNQRGPFKLNPLPSGGHYGFDDRPPVSMEDAVYPQFARMQDRKVTFTGWPLAPHFPPDDLVMLGFYYAGYADCIRCFYCGVGLKSWCTDDDVMTEHIRWRPSCGYVLNTKGRHFVNVILQGIEASSSDTQSIQPNQQNPGQVGATSPSTNKVNSATKSSPTPSARNQPSSTFRNASSSSASVSDSTGSRNAVLSRDVQKTVEEMGFPQHLVARAVKMLQQTGMTHIDLNHLVEAIVEVDTEGGLTNGQCNVGQDSEIQTDGPEEDSPNDAAEQERARRLAAENERLRERSRCKICQNAKVGMIYLPCSHIVACTDCGKQERSCSVCGQLIKGTANVFL